MARTAQWNADPYLRSFRVAKWTRFVTVTDVPRLFNRLPEFNGWTKPRHVAIAEDYLALAIISDRMWNATREIAENLYGDGSGVLISGVYRDHYPESMKDDLRTLAHDATRYYDRSLAHWLASGKRIETWRMLRDARKSEDI